MAPIHHLHAARASPAARATTLDARPHHSNGALTADGVITTAAGRQRLATCTRTPRRRRRRGGGGGAVLLGVARASVAGRNVVWQLVVDNFATIANAKSAIFGGCGGVAAAAAAAAAARDVRWPRSVSALVSGFGALFATQVARRRVRQRRRVVGERALSAARGRAISISSRRLSAPTGPAAWLASTSRRPRSASQTTSSGWRATNSRSASLSRASRR